MIFNPKLVEFIYRYMPLLDENNLNSVLSELEEAKANGNNSQKLEELLKEALTLLTIKMKLQNRLIDHKYMFIENIL